MKYVKNIFYTLCYAKDIGMHVKEEKGYILELDGILYGLARNDAYSKHYVLTHIETGMSIPLEMHNPPRTLDAFIFHLPAFNEYLSNVQIEKLNEMRERLRKTLADVQIDYYEYIEKLRNSWKYTTTRVNKGA